MGKKTLEEIGKILLVSFITILISVTTTRRVLLDSKLDRIEYETDQNKREKSHSKVHALESVYNKETHDMVLFLYEEAIKKNN